MKDVIHEISVHRDVKQAQLAVGYRIFGAEDPRIYAFSVLDAIMGRGMSSRLFVEIREKRGLSYDIGSRVHYFRKYGIWSIAAGVDVNRRHEALKVILREIERIRTRKVSDGELKRTKEFLIGNFKLSHERLISKLFYYGSTLRSFKRLVSTSEQVEGVRAVSAGEILSLAQETLSEENRAISWVLPNEEKRST